MKKAKKLLTFGLVLVLGMTTFSGCGGKDAGKTDSGSADKGSSESTAAVKVVDVDLTSEEYALMIMVLLMKSAVTTLVMGHRWRWLLLLRIVRKTS